MQEQLSMTGAAAFSLACGAGSDDADVCAGADAGGAVARRLALPAEAPGPLVDEAGGVAKRRPRVLTLLQPAAPTAFGLVPKAGADAVQRVFVQRAAASPVSRKGVTSFGASEQNAVGACQPVVDAKAFTGRGEARPVRQAISAVDAIHARMRQLAAESVAVGKNLLYLTVHARASTQQLSLRWRGFRVEAGISRHKHLSWDEAAELIASQPYAVQKRSMALDEEARDLNDQEIAARRALTRLRAAARKAEGITA